MPFFKKVKVTSDQKTPDPKKNFFQNYSDHIDFLMNRHKGKKVMPFCNDAEELCSIFNSLIDPKHLLMFDSLRDGYDYMDEVVGATAIPTFSFLVSVTALGFAIYEGANKIAISTHLKEDDKKDHGTNSENYLAVSGAALVVAVGSLLKSLISLLTRPFVTVSSGWKDQDTERFCNKNSVEGKVEQVFN